MDKKQYIPRFVASVTLVAMAYGGYSNMAQTIAAAEKANDVRPFLYLTNGEVVDPATAPEVTKFNSSTAKEFAEMVFADVETAPDLNEFLSRFTCSTCGKRCLLTAPRCSKGQGSQEKAIVIYQEMFPEVELFLADGMVISFVV